MQGCWRSINMSPLRGLRLWTLDLGLWTLDFGLWPRAPLAAKTARNLCRKRVFPSSTRKGLMNQTIQYLQSESAEQNIEIGVLVNFLLLDAITAGASDI